LTARTCPTPPKSPTTRCGTARRHLADAPLTCMANSTHSCRAAHGKLRSAARCRANLLGVIFC
jgi:hypothetical protein